MQEKQRIPVWIWFGKAGIRCLCKRKSKVCEWDCLRDQRHRDCEKDVVERDLFENWESTMRQDRYGK